MSFSAGSYHGLAYIVETTFGTRPSGTMTSLRHTSCSLGISKDGFQSNELRTDRQISDFRHGAIRTQGEFGIELSYSEYDPILEAVLFGSWANNVLKAGVTQRSYTLRRRFGDIGVDGVFTGQTFNSFSLSVPANAMITGSFNIVGSGGSYVGTPMTVAITATGACSSSANATVTVAGTGTTVALTTADDDTTKVATKIAAALHAITGYSATSNAAVVTLIYSAVDGVTAVSYSAGTTGATATVGVPSISVATVASQIDSPFDSFTGELEEGGSEIATITSIELNIQNGLEPTFVVGSNVSPRIVAGRCNITGTVSAYFEKMSLLNKFINETESSIELHLGGADDCYDIELPRIKYTGGDNAVSGEGPIVMNMPFQALYDSVEGTNIIITRTPAA